jgi:hypothetical protein
MNVNAVVFEFSNEAGRMLVIQEHMYRYAPVEATETFHANEKLSVKLGHLGRTSRGEGVGHDLHEETPEENRGFSVSVYRGRAEYEPSSRLLKNKNDPRSHTKLHEKNS